MSSSFLKLTNIQSIQIDPTTKCNLRCPQCARIRNGKVLPNLEMTELRIDDYDRIYSKEIAPQIRHSFFNGNYGDPVASTNLRAAVEMILRRTGGTVHVVTNGSLQKPVWWRDFAKLIGKRGKVTFSIDGLFDTNHLYRVGANFDRILENARMFIASGGQAKWDYLVFAHNEHQVDEARTLAKRLGFSEFNVKFSKRYISERSLKANQIHDSRVDNMTRNSTEMEHVEKSQALLRKYGSWENYFQNASISCKFQQKGMIFIDFNARLWPCTWIAAPPYFEDSESPQKQSLHNALKGYAENFNSLRHYSMEEILAHPWFDKELTQSWENERITTCARTCGDQIEYTNGFNQNSKLEKLRNADKDILPTTLDTPRNS